MEACLYPATLVVEPGSSEALLLEQVAKMFPFPFVVKPDVGMKGILFRKIENREQLLTYHRQMPATYLVQAFAPFPQEVSVFYYRMPDQSSGVITAIIQKNLLQVTGNGSATVLQLLQEQKGSEAFLPEVKKQQGSSLQHVLAMGETMYVSLVGNRMNGATFTDLTCESDATLLQLFDKISLRGNFYYGRYDIKCESVQKMKEGKDFLILEFNGAGSIPNHIYTPGYTLLKAYKEIARHWNIMYRISKANHQQGVAYWPFSKGRQFLKLSKDHFNTLKKVDDIMVLK